MKNPAQLALHPDRGVAQVLPMAQAYSINHRESVGRAKGAEGHWTRGHQGTNAFLGARGNQDLALQP